MTTNEAQRLAECMLFRGVSSEELTRMLRCLQPVRRRYDKGASIAVAGEPFTGVGIVVSGTAAVTKESATGDRLILAMLEPPMMFGEMVAFSDTTVWPATVAAQGECEVIFVPTHRIIGQCESSCAFHRQLIHNMLAIVSNRALMLNRKVEYLLLRSVREKVATYLLEQHRQVGKATFILPLDRNEMADFLNVARPALSREMGRMRDEGLIDFHRASVKILDVNALKGVL